MAKRTKRRNNRSSKRYSKKSKRSSKRSSKRYSKKRYSKKRLYKRKMMRGGMEAVDINLRNAKMKVVDISGTHRRRIEPMGRDELSEWLQRKKNDATRGFSTEGSVADFQEAIDILSPAPAAPPPAAAGGYGAARHEEEMAQAIAASLAAPQPAPAEYDEEAVMAAAMAASLAAPAPAPQPAPAPAPQPAPAPVVAYYDNEAGMAAAMAESLLTHPAAAGGKPPINVFFFDLDNTLTAKELEKRDNLIELAHPTDFSWTYTSQQVIDILKKINADPNSMWYVISAGGNSDVLDMLEMRLGFNANGRVFDLGEVTPKSEPIQQILNELKTTGNTLKYIAFIDDTQEKIDEVTGTIRNIIPIKVDSHFSPRPGQEMIEYWRNIILDNEKRQIDAILDS